VAEINNLIYEQLQQRWYEADDDPVALLRAEARARNPWVIEKISRHFGRPVSVLDVGCGAGFLSNALAAAGHQVTGIDQAHGAMQVAREKDAQGTVVYQVADARELPYPSSHFDVVCAMDVLEHVVPWQAVVSEAARVLKPGGLFIFYTFNRTFAAWLFAVKGVEWVVKNTPANLHVFELFIKPAELTAHCEKLGLVSGDLVGFGPRVFSWAFAKLLATGRVPAEFEFRIRKRTALGYLGVALKSGPSA
jgi:2-polyprenyl-6-hydroxyphenyl methylase / 3-demethylubiquinone-9 3-methyltransferase